MLTSADWTAPAPGHIESACHLWPKKPEQYWISLKHSLKTTKQRENIIIATHSIMAKVEFIRESVKGGSAQKLNETLKLICTQGTGFLLTIL